MDYPHLNRELFLNATLAGLSLTAFGTTFDPVRASEMASEGSRAGMEKMVDTELREVTGAGLSSHVSEILNHSSSDKKLKDLIGEPLSSFLPTRITSVRLADLKSTIQVNQSFRAMINHRAFRPIREVTSTLANRFNPFESISFSSNDSWVQQLRGEDGFGRDFPSDSR